MNLANNIISEQEAFRVRMVDQICQIEAYRQRVSDQEGRRLTQNQAASEWIDQYAATFPTLS